MNKKKRFCDVDNIVEWRHIIIVMLAIIVLGACSKEDGDWDPMVWKAEMAVQKTNGIYEVPAAGAEFTFSCKNYSAPWIDYAVSDVKTYYPDLETGDPHTISDDWFKAEISGNKLTVKFEVNETAEERLLQLIVTAGDIFYTFKFRQMANI